MQLRLQSRPVARTRPAPRRGPRAGQGDAASFLDHLGSYVDAFIAEYRRVRDSEACVEAGKPRPPAADSQSGG